MVFLQYAELIIITLSAERFLTRRSFPKNSILHQAGFEMTAANIVIQKLLKSYIALTTLNGMRAYVVKPA
ncbi:MAG: hypothetical protein JWN76_3662 [Chitinophagaceae bacterium]|nr:hypothetical protein [Chitinophagaceae bacterium]